MTNDAKAYICIEHCRAEKAVSTITEPPHGKTNNLHRRKQMRRSASR